MKRGDVTVKAMKVFTLVILTVVCLLTFGNVWGLDIPDETIQTARMNVGIVGGGVAAVAGGSCPADGSPDIDFNTGTDSVAFGEQADGTHHYVGTTYIPASTKQICKIGFQFIRGSGDVTDKTYTCKIWTMSGTALDAVITNGTSGSKASDGWWTATWVIFEFSGNPTMTADVTYCITVETADDATNYQGAYYTYGGALYNGSGSGKWTSAGVQHDAPVADRDMNIKIYYYD